MADGGEEGDDEWELDGLFRTVYVRPGRGRRKAIWMYALYKEREMPCEVTAHALIVFQPYLLTIEGREVLSSEHEMMGIPISFAIQNMNLLVHNPQWP
jgi:hypothetical protein